MVRQGEDQGLIALIYVLLSHISPVRPQMGLRSYILGSLSGLCGKEQGQVRGGGRPGQD